MSLALRWSLPAGSAAADRASAILEESLPSNRRVLDGWIACLLVVQWLAGIGVALTVSPRTWSGAMSQTHIHVWSALVVGGLIASLPVALAILSPGRALTHHVIAAAQMLFSALLIHLTGGRIETHFHVFGSLAILAFYLDRKVLLTATVVAATDHFVRGTWWPMSVFGVESASQWRWIEHAWWVVFEVSFLMVLCGFGQAYMRRLAEQQVGLERTKSAVEETVRERTKELEEAQRIARLGSWVYAPATGEVRWSPVMYELYGRDPALGPAPYDEAIRLYTGEDGARIDAAVKRLIETGEPFGIDVELADTRHGVTHVHSRGQAEFDGDGRLLRLVGTVHDLTERKRVEGAVAASEARARLVIDAALDAVVSMDSSGRIIGWNAQAEATFGWEADEVIGLAMAEVIVPPEMRDRHEKGLRRYLETGEAVVIGRRVEVPAVKRNGEVIPVELAISPLRTPEGVVFSAFLRDISERKRSEEAQRRYAEELARARDLAESANRAKSEFLANMSHEIRTPMAAILGFADLLLEPGLCDEERISHVQTIRGNGDHLLSILNDILDLSKIEAGGMTLESVESSPRAVLEEVLSLIGAKAAAKGIRLSSEVDASVPERVLTDPVRLRQVLLNLVGNAVKFTERGEVSVRSWSSGDGGAMDLFFEVRDTGIGLSQEQLSRLFRPFSQADGSMTRRFGGTGLGLVISRRLALMMGGGIEASSEPGKGSVFTLRVRVEPRAGEGSVPVARSVQPSAPAVVRVGGRVLLAEDGIDNRRLIVHYLTRAGLEVVTAENGREALEKFEQERAAGRPIDAVLMDMQMPELDGYGASAMLRSRGWEGPLIALTAHAMQGDRERCLRAGCDGYLTKPVDRAALVSVLAARLSGARGESVRGAAAA